MIHRPLVFIDVETTGGSPLYSRVLEVGALRIENGAVVQSMNQLINPEEAVPAFITNITGITDRHVWDKPTFQSVGSKLENILEDALFIAHNVNFDYSFIRQEFKRMGVAFRKDRLCTVRLSRKLFPSQRSHKLDELIKVHGYRVSNRHRAYDDAEVLWKFYKDQLKVHGLHLHKEIDKLIAYS